MKNDYKGGKFLFLSLPMYICVCVWDYIYHICASIDIYVACVYVYMYTYMYTYKIHAYIYTHTIYGLFEKLACIYLAAFAWIWKEIVLLMNSELQSHHKINNIF